MKLIDLTYKIDENTLNFRGLPGCQFKNIWDYHQCSTPTKFKVQYLNISAGLGTHIDSPSHCFSNTKNVSEIATEFIYETLIFDFVQFCQNNFEIELDQIKKIIEQNNFNLKNKFIIIKTGWGNKWGTKEYHNNYIFPYITKEVAEYFLKKEIAGIGIDTLSPDKITEEGYYGVHEVLLKNDIFIIENIANLDKINVINLKCIIAPLNIISTESPIRLIAIID